MIQWQPAWLRPVTHGVKNKPAADVLAYNTCKEIELSHRLGQTHGGISYDFEKCFDRVPTKLAVNILRFRGCDNKVCLALDSFYSCHKKSSKLMAISTTPSYPAMA